MQYNIAHNGSLSSPISISGIGEPNRILSYAELQSITDNNLTSSGIVLASSESIFIQLYLAERTKIEDVRLYCDDTTISGLDDISVYWKNEPDDDYQGATKGVSEDYYYATLPEPSAPLYILVTVSGIDANLFEFTVYNSDYVVAFGEDGSQLEEYIEDAPIGSIGDVQPIKIFNNSNNDMPATAYVSIDYTGSEADYYLEISNSPNGPFYSLTDGIVLENNTTTNDYIWDMGTYWSTYVTSNRIQVPSSTPVEKSYGSVPLTSNSQAWRAGQNCWDYDPVTRTIYAIGCETTVNIKLFKRNIDSGSWEYLGLVNNGVTGFQDVASMIYMDGRVYVICNVSGVFGYYTVSGTQHNWTSLTSVGWTTGTPTKLGMCSDKSRYIYAISHKLNDNNIRDFRRYDTVTSGWSAMSNSYTANVYSTNFQRACLAYDYERNMIYADVGDYSLGNYIQRYNVSDNSWDTAWFNVDAYTNATGDSNYYQTHTYYNNVLVLGHAATGTRLYYYNMSTGSITYTTLTYGFYMDADPNYPVSASVNPYILATDEPANLGTSAGDSIVAPLGIGIFGANLSNSRGTTYCLGLETNESGYYITPIFDMADPYKSSYVIVENTGTLSVNIEDVDTIQVRSSDTEPIPYYESIVVYQSGQDVYIARWSPYNNSYTSTRMYDAGEYVKSVAYAVAVSPKDGRIAIHFNAGNPAPENGFIYVASNVDPATLVYSIVDPTDYKYLFNIGFQFEGANGLWAYGNYNNAASKVLYHFDTDLSVLGSYSEGQLDFIYELAAEYNGRGCWYTNQIDNTLVHMNFLCSKLKTIQLDDPRCIVQTLDDGVWVEENGLDVVYRYDFDGNRIDTFTIPITPAYGVAAISRMCSDLNNGFWYSHYDYIFHVTENKIVDVGPVFISDPDKLSATYFGCFVHSTDDNIMYYIDMNGNVTSSSMAANEGGLFDCYGVNMSQFSEFKTACVSNDLSLPRTYDPVWGDSGSLDWTTIPKNGYTLPKKKYHQLKLYLRGISSTLTKIVIPPAVTIEDIPAGAYKNLYLRTNIPEDVDITDYQTGIKVWWDVEDN